ncbi:MAG: PepSY-associated TM helix domain-containing protein [Mucilaginibacter sp.]|uniref:PepSY-associated TM helix domain-containing protein n=1 Tax=Mucilaginibacter sp. TaxID=1882438 RepID=UPI0034E5EA28
MKTVFRSIHLYLSLAAGIIIFCSCLTGTMLVFEDETEHALHHERYFAEPQKQRLPTEQLIFSAIKTVSKAKLGSVKVYVDAERTVEVGLIVPEKGKSEEQRKSQEHRPKNTEAKEKKQEGARPNLTVFVNPYTGQVTGQLNRRQSFFFTVEMLHRFLLAGKDSVGNKIVAFSTLFFLFILITGVVLWWPKNKKIMRQRLRYKWDGSRKRLVHDLHIVTGFYTSAFLLVIVFTGLIMTFSWANKLLYAIAGSKPVSEQPKPPTSVFQAGIKPLPIGEILALQEELDKSASYTIRPPRDSAGTYTLNVLQKGAAVETANDTYFIDQYSGKVIGTQKFADKSAGQRARAFVKPIHTGSIYGLKTKIISFIVCLLSLVFPVTGVLMWLNRIKKKTGKRSTGQVVVN